MQFTDILSETPEIRSDGLDVQVDLENLGDSLAVWVTAREVTRVSLSWKAAIRDALVLGDAWERGYGDLAWKPADASRVLPWYALICENSLTYGFGVKTGCAAFAHWKAGEDRLTLVLDLRNGGSSTKLNGRRLLAASVVCREGRREESAYEAARALCTQMCDRPRFPKEPVYGINNWYYAYGRSSEEEILRDADALASWTPAGNVKPFVVIDDGWQTAHSDSYNGGPWDSGNEAFPDMKGLAEKIKGRNQRPGLWLRPLVTRERVPESLCLQRNPEELAYDRSGFSVLDPSHPEVLKKVSGMMRTIQAWGYELIKHDFTTCDLFGRWGSTMGDEMTESGWHFWDQTRTTAEIILGLYQALRQGAGDSVLLLGCNTVSHLSAGIHDLQRTGDDTSGREWERTKKMGINTLAFRMPQHNTFYGSDADCVGITAQIPWEKNRQWMDLLARSATPLFLSVDPAAVTPQIASEIREAICKCLACAEPGRREAVPLNWQETAFPDRWQVNGQTVCYDW